METSRVNIVYRPLRLAWAIHSSDREAMRRVARMTHAFWGGRYNPIVFADRPDDAKALVEVFRADLIVPVGDSLEVSGIRQRFPHLSTPLIPDELFIDRQNAIPLSQVLDIHNLLVHWNEKPEWRAIKDQGIRCISWEEDDPLADALLLSYGAYPAASEIGVDYDPILFDATMAIQLPLDRTMPIDPQIMNHPNVGYIARHGLHRHYSVRAGGWNLPGFFVGDANNIEDLVTFWNLRAADISLYFIDLNYPERYQAILPTMKANLQQRLASLPEYRQHVAIWTSSDDKFAPARELLGDGQWSHCRIGDGLWNGLNAVPPMMMLGDASSMGVIGNSSDKPSVSFTLNDKPFNGDNYFFTQHLVASVQVYRGDDEATTFHPPYVPELNEALARSMHGIYSDLRSEPERLGIVIDAADHDLRLNALPVSELIQESFKLAGLKSRPSSGGLIARQLIARLGGVDGARVFKIPGVRKLLKTYGPNAAFTRNAALQQIGGTPNFKDHERLYIEPRPHGTKLTPQLVFEYLVEKGLFRIGMELTCPLCNLANWIALDGLQQTNRCEMCGNSYDATRQLVGGEFRYRRTGVLGIEKNTQGAVPIALLLQQLGINLRGHDRVVSAPSYDLEPLAGITLPACETDFVAIENRTYPNKAAFIIGECKDEGDRIDENDINNLKQIADAIPRQRFDPYILLARLSPFSPDEIALARTLNTRYEQRAILLSQRELEPYHMYERVNEERGTHYHGGTAKEMARTTAAIYFTEPAPLTSTSS
jgi:hypothetical protein